MARKRSTGSRFNLGEPYDGMLTDFCEAAYGANATEVVRRAVEKFIQTELADNAGLRTKYREAQRRRRGLNVAKISDHEK